MVPFCKNFLTFEIKKKTLELNLVYYLCVWMQIDVKSISMR
jgi:hypothetical protein